jgi:hypothetical protein
VVRHPGVLACTHAAAVAVLLATSVAWADLEPGCPEHYYLGNDPSDSEAPDWSDNAQGVANDGTHWYFTHKVGLLKYEADWQERSAQADAGRIGSVGIPTVLSDAEINHFGDPDHHGGYVFVPFEGEGSLSAVIAAFRASDLAFVDWVDVTAYQSRAGWVAIDPVDGLLYTSTDRFVAGTPILRYALDLARIENGVPGASSHAVQVDGLENHVAVEG